MNATTTLRRTMWRTTKAAPGLRQLYDSHFGPMLHAAVRDPWNRARFGADAPRFAERLWIDPRAVRWHDRKGIAWKSAHVVTGAWHGLKEKPIEEDPIMQSSIERWMHGKSWDDSGEIERMLDAIQYYPGHAGCNNLHDIRQRCARLDDIFRVIERERRVRSQDELDPRAFREFGGIGMHLGPDGRLIRAGHGRHRFAMAWILEIPSVPVRVGLVHRSAFPVLKELRRAAP